MSADFTFALFSTRPETIRRCVAAGVSAIIVSWESQGKEARQCGYNTDLSVDTLEDLRRVRACTDARVICRINPYGEITEQEVETAIGAGADEILLPMVRSPSQVQRVWELIRGRCDLGILVETLDAVAAGAELARFPLEHAYVGLNDLSIERGTTNLFEAVADGTVGRLRRVFDTIPFGFAGLTLSDRGHPIPCRLLIGEMVRIGCRFSFLRRSFHRDIRGHDPAVEIPHLLEAIRRAHLRSPAEVARDRRDLETAIHAWPEAVFAVQQSFPHGHATR